MRGWIFWWKLVLPGLLSQQGPASGCRHSTMVPGATVGGIRADYGVRDYRIIARNATGLVSSCLLGLALLTPTGPLTTIMAA